MDAIPILIVDDAPLFRQGVRASVAEAPAEFTVVGEAADGARTLELALTHEPAVVLLNTARAGLDGLAVIRTLKRQVPGAVVIVVVDREEEDTLFAAITDGAAADLPQSVDAGDLREIEVLGVVAQGHSNKEIAAILGISNQTVKNHITAIMRKLAVNDRTHAVVYALRHGWIPDAPGARRGAAAPGARHG